MAKKRIHYGISDVLESSEINSDDDTIFQLDQIPPYINDIVILLSENEMLNIEIIGHTDNVGTRDANQYISENRAEVVKNYLVEKGVDVARIETKGMGDKQPLFENDTKENRSKNRRVEFVIYY